MEKETLSLLQQAISEGVASSAWLLVVIATIASAMGAYLGAYLRKSAEQKAAKGHFPVVLDQIKEQTEITKRIEADITQDLHFRTEIFLPRIEAYKTLWAATYPVRPTKDDPIMDDEKELLWKELTSWYYASGNGIFLSLKAGRQFRDARRALRSSDDGAIKTAFSDLREQLKTDVRVYGEYDRSVELGT